MNDAKKINILTQNFLARKSRQITFIVVGVLLESLALKSLVLHEQFLTSSGAFGD